MVVNLTLVGANGDTIPLDNGSDFVLSSGFSGTGLTSSQLRITASAGDGGTWRGTRKASRDLDVPLTVLGSTRDDVEAKLRRFAAALSDRYGVPKLRASYDDGTSYDLAVHYVAGAETTYGEDAGNLFCNWNMSWKAPDPFWVSNQAVQFTVTTSGEVRGLLAAPVGQTATLSALRVSSSQALGLITIENPGDVDSFPVYKIEGPATNVAITLNGVGFTYTETLVAGNIITIDTKSATVTNAAGVNKYGFLGTSPKLFRIPPGTSSLSIEATGADASTKISGYFNPRREVIF